MNIVLCNNNSEKNKINKTLTNQHTFTGTLKEETNVTNPVILMELENPTNYNYAYIPEFRRFYYIDDFVVVRSGLWRVSLSVDVLESFKNEILNTPVLISDSENINNNYLTGNVWKSNVKESTSIINFPTGLSENGEFILITAGG